MVCFLSNCNHIVVCFPVFCCLFANCYVLLLFRLFYFRACSGLFKQHLVQKMQCCERPTWFKKNFKNIFSSFYGWVQLSHDCSDITGRLFIFYHQVLKSSMYLSDRSWEDERLSQHWSHPVRYDLGSLDLESSALTARPLL